MGALVEFLKHCIEREKDNRINPYHTHINFQRFLDRYNGENIKDKKYKEVLDTIKETHYMILNKKDETAMDYKETGYNTAKSLVLSNQKKGYNLTSDENITKLNSAAFITTAIILEATASISLIFMLLALVK